MKTFKFLIAGTLIATTSLVSCGNKDEESGDKSVKKDKVSLCECAGMDYGVTTEAGLLKKYGEDVLNECDKYFSSEDFQDKARACPELEDFFKDMDEFENMMEGVDPNLPPGIPGDVDCDKFLAEYESFIKEYLELTKKINANSKDMSLITKYSNLSIKAGEFMNSAIACAMDPEYSAKLEKLSKDLEQAAVGM